MIRGGFRFGFTVVFFMETMTMPKIELSEIDVETLIYALGVATADLKESLADPTQSAEDKQEWTTYVAEIEEVSLKLTSMAAAA